MRTTFVLAATALALGALGVETSSAAAGLSSTLTGAPTAVAAPKPKPDPKPSSVTLGETGPGICGPAGPAAVVIDTQAAGRPSYIAPSSGVITSFAHQAGGANGRVQLIVFADSSVSTTKTVAGRSTKLTVARNALNSFPVRIPVAAGQRIGLGYSTSGMACAFPGSAGDATLVKSPFDPDTTSTFAADGVLTSGGSPYRPNVSAVLESDIDRDGYGDITQDGCPASKKVQAACPDTKITKKPKRKATRSKVLVKVKFTATIAGSTFECRLDGHKKWKKCHSPYKRRLGPGRHVLKVRAVSTAGVADPKPAKVRFTIRRR